jgi:aryl-alcohol dehydrogenase-like predicted oxidoreductase
MTDSLPFALGAMMFGTRIDEATSFALLDRFVDAGGTWIDTADCYAFWDSPTGHGGASEELLGRWFAARPGMRERVKLSTKFGAEPGADGRWPDNRQGLSPAAIRAAFDGSLRRLGVDHVDLVWAHMEDRSVPIEQTADAMAALVLAGRAARIGTSNHPAWRVERARAHALSRGAEPITALQHSFSYLHPRPLELPEGQNHRFGMLDDELRDLAEAEGLWIWAYTPLMSGAYDNPSKPIPDAHRHPGTDRALAALDAAASALGAPRGQVVFAWLIAQGIMPILGGSKVEQLDAAISGARLALPADIRTSLDAAQQPT